MKKFLDSCITSEDGTSLFQYFHKETSLTHQNSHFFDESIAAAFENNVFMKAIRETPKTQKLIGNTINLSSESVTNDVLNTILNRRSVREFSTKNISFSDFSGLLTFAYGKSKHGTLTVPSAGGTYPIKLLIFVKNVEKLEAGIYEYLPSNSCLLPLIVSDNIDWSSMTANSVLINRCAFSIHFISNPDLICYKYQDRGYKFMNLECGHIAQNLSILAEYFHIGSVCSGGYLDGELFQYLEKNGLSKFNDHLYLYEMFFGYPQ